MAKKLTLLSLFFLLFGTVAIAQSGWNCGFDKIHKDMVRADHNYEKAVRRLNNNWVSMSKLGSIALPVLTPKGLVYEVPMVIHVIHTGDAVGTKYNPDSTKIAGMIDSLNKAYEAVSPYKDTTTGATGGGTRIPIKFVLAKRSPTGAATNGIVRIDGTLTYSNYDANGINANSSAGITSREAVALSNWPPSDYYNVYIVHKIDGIDLYTSGGIAGFAYFPGSPSVDGMYVAASQVRGNSTTVAHEFGHAFSLYHTFEGDLASDGVTIICPTESDCNTDNDMVCDTEPHKRSASYAGWCPLTAPGVGDVNTCTGGASFKNTTYNIMDYTNCPPDRFTKGQRDRVMATLDYWRSGYKSSLGLKAPTGPVVTAACTPSSSSTLGNFGPVRVELKDMNVWTGDLRAENAAYVDHAYTQQLELEKGVPYPISVTTDINRQNVRVFIDLNGDGDFSDAGENVFSNNGTTSGEEVHSGTITLPASTTTCKWLRMRVVAAWSSTSVTDYACGTYSADAQAEDYGIYVKNRSAVDTVTIEQTAGTNPSCTGSSVTYTATPKSGTPTYRWFVNGVATGVTTNTYTSTSLADGSVITCRIYYTGSCGPDSAESNSIVQLVNSTAAAKATINLIEGANPGCSGLKLVFEASVAGGGSAPKYQWKLNGNNLGGDVDTLRADTLKSGDQVWCVVTPNSTCSTTPVNSDTITIDFGTVTPMAHIMLGDPNPSCDSTDLNFSVGILDGGDKPILNWFVNGTAVPGATSDVFFSNTLKNNDTVRCRVISRHPCIVPGIGDTAWSDSVVVLRIPKTVPALDVKITYGSNPGCLDSLIEFTATYSEGGGSPNVIWYINDVLAGYGAIYSTSTLLNGDKVTCKLEVTPGSCNTADSVWFGPIEMVRSSVPPTPVISLIGTLLVSSVPDVQWYGPGGLIPGATGPTYHPTEKGNYYAVSDNNGCLSPSSNVLNVALLSVSPANMEDLRIYPNPSSGQVTLDWTAAKVNVLVDVYTVTGQRVHHSVVENASSQTLDLTSLSNGNYFIVIRDNAGKAGTVSITLSR